MSRTITKPILVLDLWRYLRCASCEAPLLHRGPYVAYVIEPSPGQYSFICNTCGGA